VRPQFKRLCQLDQELWAVYDTEAQQIRSEGISELCRLKSALSLVGLPTNWRGLVDKTLRHTAVKLDVLERHREKVFQAMYKDHYQASQPLQSFAQSVGDDSGSNTGSRQPHRQPWRLRTRSKVARSGKF
jgi:hypothetical protein